MLWVCFHWDSYTASADDTFQVLLLELQLMITFMNNQLIMCFIDFYEMVKKDNHLWIASLFQPIVKNQNELPLLSVIKKKKHQSWC